MITSEGLIKQISSTIGKTKVLELSLILKEQNFTLRDLIDLTFYADKNIAFRAAWILENLFLKEPELYEADLDYLIVRIKDVKYASCQRHYAKIWMHITEAKTNEAIKKKLKSADLEPVVEKCFDWLIDPKVKAAVKVFAADTLFNLKDRYPWITEELENQVKFLMKTGSAAIQFRGKKLLSLI
ncbi:hypothetical protein [Mucilaginibacter sp.]|uniref:hypothetical protein n=1 Tax=Mucilaginibacter sp. TaxID=1882438 RepID=UPI003D13F5C1